MGAPETPWLCCNQHWFCSPGLICSLSNLSFSEGPLWESWTPVAWGRDWGVPSLPKTCSVFLAILLRLCCVTLEGWEWGPKPACPGTWHFPVPWGHVLPLSQTTGTQMAATEPGQLPLGEKPSLSSPEPSVIPAVNSWAAPGLVAAPGAELRHSDTPTWSQMKCSGMHKSIFSHLTFSTVLSWQALRCNQPLEHTNYQFLGGHGQFSVGHTLAWLYLKNKRGRGKDSVPGFSLRSRRRQLPFTKESPSDVWKSRVQLRWSFSSLCGCSSRCVVHYWVLRS